MTTSLMNRWNNLASLQEEINRIFDGPPVPAEVTMPAVDVLRSSEKLIIRADLPGVRKEDVEVTVLNGRLVISGEKRSRESESKVHGERFYGKFERIVNLPRLVAADQVTASLNNGVLEVQIPFREEAKPRVIEIETH